ncbi:hypothetical protein HaLaN_09348, partial [Haematococcus lacustris]
MMPVSPRRIALGFVRSSLLGGSRGPAGCIIGLHSPQAHRPTQPTARKSSEAPVGVASELNQGHHREQ